MRSLELRTSAANSAPTGRRLAALALIPFCVAQILDGWLTYAGLLHLGLEAEANPIVAWYTAAMGPGLGLLTVKLYAIVCGTILFLTARPMLILVLTGVYLGAAIVPWLAVLRGVLLGG
jgi:hypothetical protein